MALNLKPQGYSFSLLLPRRAFKRMPIDAAISIEVSSKPT
jgi:hypothetical protein